jgi:2-polyprenyl-3-methyl-5-hydroxy-6-metoxy-1,4-benzoquinol methylase
VTCIEPAENLAAAAAKKELKVHPLTIQEFTTTHRYDCVLAISSLIHVPKAQLPTQVEKIAKFLKPRGTFFVSFIEGTSEGLEDPTNAGKERYFSRLSESELAQLFAPYFDELARREIYNRVMDRTFFLRVYVLKDSRSIQEKFLSEHVTD